MSYLLFRQIFKEIGKLSKQEPFIANDIKGHLRQHLTAYYQSREKISRKFKKQQDHLLASSFLNFLRLVNLPNEHKGYVARVKLVQIFLGINFYVDKTFSLRREEQSNQMRFLQKYSQFTALAPKDKEFVKNIVKRVLKGQQTYNYSNLTDFFKDQKQTNPQQAVSRIPLLTAQKRQYAENVTKGQVQGVSKQFSKIYGQFLNYKVSEKSNMNLVLQSYDQSYYILLNFDDLSVKK